MRVLFLHDEIPPDARADVADALVQAEYIGGVLKRQGHDILQLAFTADLSATSAAIRDARPDVVFNLVESVGGQGRLLHFATALLDSIGLPYTGNKTEPMFLTTGKLLAKRWMIAHGIDTPAWHDGKSLHGTPSGQRYIVKSVWEEASIGIDDSSIVSASDAATLAREIDRRSASLGGEAFAEEFIKGREFNLSLLTTGDASGACELLPPAEIDFAGYAPGKPRIVGYAAKWHADSFEYQNTPRRFDFPQSDQPLIEQLGTIAKKCWQVFGLSGYARVDFRVDSHGRPWMLEINANPCLSPDAGFMAAADRAGRSPETVIDRIIKSSMI
ncbi:MAG TPA: D-alanine--D-alanine ligase [Phycisphaerae bacterium]|nr:D-alanine--D-alanine ligase [Phycisphaerae bacterium]